MIPDMPDRIIVATALALGLFYADFLTLHIVD